LGGHGQIFCSVHFGSIGRISEVGIQSLVQTAMGQLIQAAVRLVMQVADALGDSAADGDGWCMRRFDERPVANAVYGQTDGQRLAQLGKRLQRSPQQNFPGPAGQ
jgi:hypothetical protein